MNFKEEWRPVKGFPNFEVSNLGRVKNIRTGRFPKGSEHRQGYIRIDMWEGGKRKQKRLHRLIAQEFIPNPYNKPEVNHIDGDKKNNKVSNLEWVTPKENIAHSIKKGLFHFAYEGEKSNLCKYSNDTVREIYSYKDSGKTYTEVADIFGCTRQYVSLLWRGKTRTNF